MDFPSYPVDIVLPSFNPADTAHRQFFLAFRKDQKACSKRCNAVRRMRDWRKNQEQHEYQRKLRGARPLQGKKRKRRSNEQPSSGTITDSQSGDLG
jgi:hypothetical protein